MTSRTALSLVAAAAFALAACSPIVRQHGYVPPEEDLRLVTVGVDTRESVEALVGRPSSSGVLADGGYYYVASKQRIFGPMQPRLIDREVVAISFDEAGVVQNVERFGLERGVVVPLSRRVTDSGSADPGFLRQIFRNLGRIDPGRLLEN